MSERRLKKIMNIDWTLIIENFKCIVRPKIFTQNWIGNLCYIYNCSIFFVVHAYGKEDAVFLWELSSQRGMQTGK